MLTLALQDGSCHTFIGKKFPIKRCVYMPANTHWTHAQFHKGCCHFSEVYWYCEQPFFCSRVLDLWRHTFVTVAMMWNNSEVLSALLKVIFVVVNECWLYVRFGCTLDVRLPTLDSIVCQKNTLLLWPGPDAEDLGSFMSKQHCHAANDVRYTLVILDGTWHQARSLYNQNSFLHSLKQVMLQSRFSFWIARSDM